LDESSLAESCCAEAGRHILETKQDNKSVFNPSRHLGGKFE
jgi:hypothetical protein